MKKKAAWIPWLTGLLMSAALMAAIFLFGDLRYAMNDDTAILRQYMGFGTGEIPEAHAFLHPLLSTPLRWLGLAAPEVAWFSWMQLALLWLAGAVSVKALMQCFAKRGLSMAAGAGAGAVYLTLFVMTYACHVTFTVTAAVLGAAAVLQLCSIDGERYTDGQIFRSLLLALALTALCGGLRLICVLPVALFCALALVPLAMRDFGFGRKKKRSWKPLLCGVCVIVLALGAMPVWRAAKMKAAGMEDYLNWQDANGRVLDYYEVTNLTEEELELAGWTRKEADLLAQWCFLGSELTEESFHRLADELDSRWKAHPAARLQSAWQKVTALPEADPVAGRSALALLAALLLCALGLAFKREERLWPGLTLAAGLLAVGAFLMYLGWNGRLPVRAALQAVLPYGALVFGLLPVCLPKKPGKATKPVLAAGTALLLALTVCYAAPTVQALAKPAEDPEALDPFSTLDMMAAEDPECLYFYDESLCADSRMFPGTEYGIPANLLFWGGWTFRSPEYMKCLSRFGISEEEMDTTLFLRDDVYLARGMIMPEPTALIDVLSEKTEEEIAAMQGGEEGGVYAFQFY
ncbi:MAG: hypothetical protein MR748_02230 [Clostridiales bacterium]|nr:hypothetical protein [Clostridiales bacterium]